jgi:hypothetical protein
MASRSGALRIFFRVLLLAGLLMPSLTTFGQNDQTIPLEKFFAERRPRSIRKFLRNFHLGLALGYNRSFFSHRFDGFGVYQSAVDTVGPRIFPDGGAITSGHRNWFNNSVPSSNPFVAGEFAATSDTTKLGFKAGAWSIPLRATLHYEFKNYRLGGGYTFEYMNIGTFRPRWFEDQIDTFEPESPSGFVRKYFGTLGMSFYRIDKFLFTGDVEVGGFKLWKDFNRTLLDKGIYVNAGVTVEREMSEYFRLFVRPSFDYKYFTMNLPESGGSVTHNFLAFNFNIGGVWSLPELPKCFQRDCRVQMNHVHGDREYRSRVHPFWKKQNPHTGENYPNLIRYKGKNKKKLNPY